MAKIRPDEVSEILAQRIENFQQSVSLDEVGVVIQVGDGIARVYGLTKAMSNEMIEFPGDNYGVVLNLEEENVGCILFGPDEDVKEGDTVRRTGRILEVPVGEALVGPACKRCAWTLRESRP